MMNSDYQVQTFPKGGVHPPSCKFTSQQPIEFLLPPKSVTIPMSQHFGTAAVPIVKVGDKVRIGQLIAQASGFLSANVHATVCGTIAKVDLFMDISGYKRLAIVINNEGEEWIDQVDLSKELKKECTLNATEIIKKAQDHGIVGLGGATFPTHIKLSPPKNKKADVLLINAAECEPYLTADHRLMIEQGPEIMVGIHILMRALAVKKAMIGIESNKMDVIDSFIRMAKDFSDIEIIPLMVKYPQGAEKQLIEAMIQRQVPIGGLPIDVGCVVHNVGTAFAVYESIQKNKPLIQRVVSVAGESLKRSANFWVRFGTPISYLIDSLGGLPDDTGKIISGGPMMGKALNTPDVPVTKGTSGIIVLPRSQSKRDPVLPCIRCARCVSHCPLGLEPYLLMNLVERSCIEQAAQEEIMNCCECGSCAYICPSKRPLLDSIRLGKSLITQQRQQKAAS